MSNENVEIKIFPSARRLRSYDRNEEQQITDVIRKEIMPKVKAEYQSVNIKVKRTVDGAPESLIAYMLRKDTYTADVKKIDIDKTYTVKTVHEEYDDTDDIDDAEEDVTRSMMLRDRYVDFVVATPNPEIPTARRAVEYISKQVNKAGLSCKVLLGEDATVSNYQRYLSSGLRGFINIGHGFTGGIVLHDGVLRAGWFEDVPGKRLSPAVVYFNSCQVFNKPLQPAVMKAGARTYVGGIVNLFIGSSEEVCKCFWDKALSGTTNMKQNLVECEIEHYPDKGAHDICGDLGPFRTGEVIAFQHANMRGHHRHIFEDERNLNHVEDSSLNDKISSFVVVSGVWKFYRHSNFKGNVGGEFLPGVYHWVEAFGVPNDQVSSMRCIHS